MPHIKVESQIGDRDGYWLLYGGRVAARVPATATITPSPDDVDPLDLVLRLTLDIVGGRLGCVSLTAERLDDGPAVTSEALRRVPVAEYVARSALEGDVLRERIPASGSEWTEVSFRPPPADFTKDGMTDEALEQVSRIYAMAQASGAKATGILLNDYRMTRPTSTRWLQAARRRGILKEDHQKVSR